MENFRFIFLKSVKIALFFLLIYLSVNNFAQSNPKIQNKTISAKLPKVAVVPLPHSVFFQLIDSTDKFEINQSAEFKHVEVPKKFYNQFTSYIKDSAVSEVQGLKSLVYYNYTLKSGNIVNGDIYWNDTKSYIVFGIDGKKYVNFFTKEGVKQIKAVFKL